MAGRVLALLIGWLVLSAAPGVWAQAQPAPSAQLDHAQSELKTLAQAAHRPDLDDAGLVKLQAAVAPVEAEIHAAIDPLRPQLAAADARLSALGPAPARGAPPEAAAISHDRRAQTSLRMALDAQIKRGDLLLVEADQLAARLAAQRVDSFSRQLQARSRSVLDPEFWGAAGVELPHDLDRWRELLNGQARVFAETAEPRPLGLAGLAAALALVMAWPVRELLVRLTRRLAAARTASARLRRAELAVAEVAIRSVLPVAAASLFISTLSWTELLSRQMEHAAWVVVRAIGFLAAASALGRALLAPRRPDARLARVGDATAAALAPYPAMLGAAAAFGLLVLGLARVVGVSLPGSVAAQAVVAAVHLAVLALALSALGRRRAAELGELADGGRAGAGRGVWTLALLAAWLAIAAGVVALLFGFVAFALFLTRELVWVGLVGAALHVLVSLSDAFFAELAPDEGSFGRFAVQAMGLGARTLDQMAVLLTGAARVVLWLFAWAAVMIPFGAGANEALSHLQAGATVLHLGGVTLSPLAIAASIGLFVLGLFVTRLFRRWLETQYLPRTHLDVGLSATVGTGVSYIGGVLALLAASAYLGLKLTQVTLIASALTVGIGFGLQSVIQNFVAGLILLAGRPIRVGDWIAVGGQEGDVQRINVRATEIKLFDGSMLILPNQELVTKPVRNVTWGAPLGQIVVNITVGYEADLDAVTAILLEAMKRTKGVLKEPPPSVAVVDFHDSGAAIRGVAYAASPRSVYKIKSEVLLELGRRLRAAGVRPGVDAGQALAALAARPAPGSGGA